MRAFGAGEIDSGLLFVRLDLEQDDVLRIGVTDDDLTQQSEVGISS